MFNNFISCVIWSQTVYQVFRQLKKNWLNFLFPRKTFFSPKKHLVRSPVMP